MIKQKQPNWSEFMLTHVWEKREHRCQCCGNPLGLPVRNYYFSHVLSKGAWKVAAWWPENIILMCWDCHQAWEFGGAEAVSGKEFNGAKILASALIQAISYLRNTNYFYLH